MYAFEEMEIFFEDEMQSLQEGNSSLIWTAGLWFAERILVYILCSLLGLSLFISFAAVIAQPIEAYRWIACALSVVPLLFIASTSPTLHRLASWKRTDHAALNKI